MQWLLEAMCMRETVATGSEEVKEKACSITSTLTKSSSAVSSRRRLDLSFLR